MIAGHRIGLGGFGVPLFFVISGFIMVVITDDSSRPWPFIRSRLIRVVPLYWLATTVAALITLFLSYLSWRHLAFSYAFLPLDRPGAEEHFFPVLGLGWTLNYEMLFYALFALSLTLPRRLQIPTLSLVMLSLVLVGFLIQPDAAIAAFWTEPIILLFLAGVWMGVWWSSERPRILWPLLGCAVALLLVIRPEVFHFREALWGGIWAVLMLLAVLVCEGQGLFTTPFRPLHLLGDASYSVYLWHMPLLNVLTPGLRAAGISGVWDFLLITLIVSIAAGLISYQLIERPLLRLFNSRVNRRNVRAPAGPRDIDGRS
jgi:exopolysaccharide production protein ExoZ